MPRPFHSTHEYVRLGDITSAPVLEQAARGLHNEGDSFAVHVQSSAVSAAIEEVAPKKRRGVRGLGSIYEYKGVLHYSIPRPGYDPIVRSSKKWTSRAQANAAREAHLRELDKGTSQRPNRSRGRSLSEFALQY